MELLGTLLAAKMWICNTAGNCFSSDSKHTWFWELSIDGDAIMYILGRCHCTHMCRSKWNVTRQSAVGMGGQRKVNYFLIYYQALDYCLSCFVYCPKEHIAVPWKIYDYPRMYFLKGSKSSIFYSSYSWMCTCVIHLECTANLFSCLVYPLFELYTENKLHFFLMNNQTNLVLWSCHTSDCDAKRVHCIGQESSVVGIFIGMLLKS